MRTPITTATSLLFRRRSLSKLSSQVVSPFSLFFVYKSPHISTTTTSIQLPPQPNPPPHSPSFLAKSLLAKHPHLLKGKIKKFSVFSFKDCIFKLSTVNPGLIRKFRRVSELKPEDILEILVGFECKCEEPDDVVEVEIVKSLYGLCNWASEKVGGFEHLPKSYELMVSMLVKMGLLRESEKLLSTMEDKGISLDNNEILSDLVRGYVKEGEAEKGFIIYNRMRTRGLLPSLSCFRVIIELFIGSSDTHQVCRTYTDMVEMGLGLDAVENGVFDKVIRLLCRDGKVQEARNLVKKVITKGNKPSNIVLDEIASGYCEKKDYDDLVKFFADTNTVPNVIVGNKIIYSLCRNFGEERASFFLKDMEDLGFIPDEITFGILVGWSCHESNLKNAFIYLSQILTRSQKPHVRTYNSLISGVFKEGVWKYAREILCEMDDKGVIPSFETFKILLAGYSKARQFDEAKVMVQEMVERGLVNVSALEDPLSKAFELLGFDPLTVKLRRDNDVGLLKTEFYDNLGNGLYLDTDIIKYDKNVTRVLDDLLIPDFNSLILENCGKGNFDDAIIMVGEMVNWGQELSSSAFSELVKGLCTLKLEMKTVVSLVEKMPQFTNQLDHETLNLLVQALSKKGFSDKASTIFVDMFKGNLDIHCETYNALFTSLCRARNCNAFLICLKLASVNNWSPKPKDCKTVFSYLCQQQLLKEALELFENVFVAKPSERLHICHVFLEALVSTGFTSIAHALVVELQNQGFALDHICYSYLVKGFFKEKARSTGFFMLENMLAKDLVPSLDVTVLSLSQLCRAREFQKAISLKEIALREQSSIHVHNALIGGFCKSDMVDVAANIFRDILFKGSNANTEACNMLLQGYFRTNNLNKAMEIWGTMIRRNLRFSISSYRELVSYMCANDKVQLALNVKELLLKERDPPPYIVIYNILIFSLFRTKNSSFVEALLDELLQKGLQLDAVTCNFLVDGYCRCGEVALSLKYYTLILSTAYRPSNRSIRAIFRCLCSIGCIEKALELSREMVFRGWTHDSVIQNAIVEGLLGQKKLEEAINFLDQMMEKDLIPDNINYDNIIKQLCRFQREDKAVDLLNIMLKKASIPSTSTYDDLIQCFCNCYKVDRALDLFYEMLDMNLEPSLETWDVVVCNLCQIGQTLEAERLINLMIHMGEKPTRKIYCSLIDRFYYQKNLSKASEYMQKMQKSGYEPDFGTHWSLISNLKNKTDENSSKSWGSFLSRLLSDSGFAPTKYFKAK